MTAPVTDSSILLEAHDLKKSYGPHVPVDGLSLCLPRGTTLGLLGPNGAGKSTTMKVVTCYLPPTEGTVSVCGHDVVHAPDEVRSRIGYLPEDNPLYKDMYVK